MAKTIIATYSASWCGEVEVPDDFVVTEESVQMAILEKSKDFDFTDGGADWELVSATVEENDECSDEFYY